jgi:arsenate reductase-like glutaredoxin family protein
LRNAGLTFEEINYAKTPLTADVVEKLVELAGGVTAVLNARHAVAKEKDWATKPPAARVFAEAAAKEPNLLKRPIVVTDDEKIIVGFNKTAYKALT